MDELLRWLTPFCTFEEDHGGGAGPSPEEAEPEPKPSEEDPPWGSDENFDPQRAWNKLQAQDRDKAALKKRADEAEAKAKRYEDADKTDKDKLEERASGAEQRASAAEATALRLDVALEKAPEGMSIAQVRKLAKRLSGDSREDLEADAEELFADFVTEDDDKGQAPRGRPRERLRPGAVPNNDEPVEPGLSRLARAYRQ